MFCIFFLCSISIIVVPFVKVRKLFPKCKVRSQVRYLSSLHVNLQFPLQTDVLHSAYFTSRPVLFPSALVLAQNCSYAVASYFLGFRAYFIPS